MAESGVPGDDPFEILEGRVCGSGQRTERGQLMSRRSRAADQPGLREVVALERVQPERTAVLIFCACLDFLAEQHESASVELLDVLTQAPAVELTDIQFHDARELEQRLTVRCQDEIVERDPKAGVDEFAKGPEQ